MKFLVDMPISPLLAEWLKEQGHNAIHAAHIGLDRSSDEDIIAQAKAENRIILTADLDYPRLLALMDSKGPGLILFRGGNYNEKEMLKLLKRVLKAVPEQELPNSVVVVDKIRIRRRRLPFELID